MLDWEENLFRGLKALYGRAFTRPEKRRRAAVRAVLPERRLMLLWLARMLAGRPVDLFEAASPFLCGNERIFLPPEISVAPSRESNRALYELKTIVGALALRGGWQADGPSLAERLEQERSTWPYLGERLQAMTDLNPTDFDVWAFLGQLPQTASRPADAPGVSGPTPVDPASAPGATETTTEIEGQGQMEVTVLPVRDDDGPGADMPMHTFEKVETLEEYNGASRKSDAADEIEEHADALSELRMTHVLRSAERPRSIYRAELILDGLGCETSDRAPTSGLPYPEWDFRRREYRRDWCHVQEGAVNGGDVAWAGRVAVKHRELIRRLKRQFAALTTDWLRLRRQPSGTDLDLDAVVHSETERRTGHTPDEWIYVNRRRDLHEVAALVLLDVSYSTDAWLDNRHVLEVIAETVFCLGEVLEDYVEKFALAAFSSNTRRACRFDVVKGFDEPWRQVRGKLSGLVPCGYTRIGPALRHAHELLVGERAARKITLLVTDGRPCDYDRYEGQYGMQDVKKAIEVGKRHGIHTHAFAIERQAAAAFPSMFGFHYDILARPAALAQTMCRLFARWLAD